MTSSIHRMTTIASGEVEIHEDVLAWRDHRQPFAGRHGALMPQTVIYSPTFFCLEAIES